MSAAGDDVSADAAVGFTRDRAFIQSQHAVGVLKVRPLVLCYHAISEAWDDALAVTPAAFERQVRSILARGYRPAAAADVASANGKLLHVTFDDAFRSIETALPVLEQLGVPATVFACPGFADEGKPLAVPELAVQAREHPQELATMRWTELRGLVERGIEVGSHTVTHAHLVEVDDRQLRAELGESRQRIEDELAAPCRFLAYPYGEEDARVRAAARASGYDAAFALPGRQAPVDVYAVPRVGIWQKDGPVRVAIKTSAAGRRLLLEPLRSARERWPRLARHRERVSERSLRSHD